jgi:hypothetical protein
MNIQVSRPPPTGVQAPQPPKTLAETGLNVVMIRDILLKTMFRMNLFMVSDIARAISLPVVLTQEMIDLARTQRLLEAMGTLNATSTSNEMSYQLTDLGKARALDALAQSEYYGALPVPLAEYAVQMKRQSVRDIKMTREQLMKGMGHLILPPDLIGNLGPAVTSGRSILMYGPPGNGKSSISNGIRAALGDKVYIPRAIEYSGQVITVFDPIVHSAAEADESDPTQLRRTVRFDNRYVRCERPVVITGGELTLDMLDLKYNAVARTYTAPLQLKASGGIFIVDDLGRQADPPQKLVNRWIVPLEEARDILQLQSGEKFTVPFDTLVIFSTNFHPNEIFDGAALRRIFFKIKIDGPNQDMFLKIFAMVAKKKGMALNEASLVHLLRNKYPTIGMNFANYQPTFLIDQMISVCDFECIPYQMTPDLIDRAWGNMFVRQEAIAR